MTEQVDAQTSLRLKMMGYIVSQAIFAVVDLDVPDLLANGPRTVGDLARETGAHPGALVRFLRVLAAEDIVTEPEPRTFALTDQGQLLRRDTVGSLRNLADLMAGEAYTAWSAASHSVRTGKPAFENVFGAPYFTWLRENPGAAERFDRAQAGLVELRMLPLLGMEWASARTVVDIGGGNGALLARVLVDNPHLSGVCFDLPHTAPEAANTFARLGVVGRAQHVAGDFFADVLPDGDVYVLSQILHDWDDQAADILTRCRQGAGTHGVVRIVEQVLPEAAAEPHPGRLLDLHMLVLLGGRERTLSEWDELLLRSGLVRTVVSEGPRSVVIEAVANNT